MKSRNTIRIGWTTSNICHKEPHYIKIHLEKETEEAPGSIGLNKKPEQTYGLILEDDDDDKPFEMSTDHRMHDSLAFIFRIAIT